MSVGEDPFAPLRRQPGEPPDEWAARLREHLQAAWDTGERPSASEYAAALPELHTVPEALLDLIALHRLLRTEAGETPRVEDDTAAFPDLMSDIQELFVFEDAVHSTDPNGTVPQPHEERPPALPARFRFVRWLGSGAYGRVCECQDTAHADRAVAVKLLNSDRTSPADRERFRREAELAAGLNHPHLCTLHEFDFDHAPPFLVFELVRGWTLRELLAGGPLPVAEAVRIARDMAAALAHCHAHGVIHRDLKPENVKRRPDGIVKVLDLGFARPVAPAEGTWTSGERTVAGTVPYFSPEHFNGDPREAADQFSLGIVLYELLTGGRPFAADSVQGMMCVIATEEPRPPGEVCRSLGRRLNAAALRMLAKRPGERFASMDDVRAELDRCLTEMPAPRKLRWVAALAVAFAVLAVSWVIRWQSATTAMSDPAIPGRVEPVLNPQSQDLAGVLQRIASDLVVDVREPDHEFQRYFRLGHLTAAEQGSARDALKTLLPRLSASGAAVPLKDVNGDGTLLRVDLRALGWRPDGAWEAVVRRCPLSLRYVGPDLPPAGGTVKLLLKTELTPFVLADWFAAAASADPLLGALLPDKGRRAAVQGSERLRAFREAYDRAPVDLNRAAAELGSSSPVTVRDLLVSDEALTKRLGLAAWIDGGDVPRSRWNRAEIEACPAAELATELKLGIRRIVARD